jgi:hypothetical protein
MLPEGSAARHFKTRPIESIWLGETNRRLHCDGRRRGQCGGNSGPSSLRSGDGAAWQQRGQCRAGRRRESQTAGRSGLLPARSGSRSARDGKGHRRLARRRAAPPLYPRRVGSQAFIARPGVAPGTKKVRATRRKPLIYPYFLPVMSDPTDVPLAPPTDPFPCDPVSR